MLLEQLRDVNRAISYRQPCLRPSESLNVEIKRWINPDEPEGIAKIVKAALAIRNRNGGFLLVGFEDKTWMPDTDVPADVRAAFNLDKIQGIVSRFASESFEVSVGFGTREGQEYPVIIIPEGVRTPVEEACVSARNLALMQIWCSRSS